MPLRANGNTWNENRNDAYRGPRKASIHWPSYIRRIPILFAVSRRWLMRLSCVAVCRVSGGRHSPVVTPSVSTAAAVARTAGDARRTAVTDRGVFVTSVAVAVTDADYSWETARCALRQCVTVSVYCVCVCVCGGGGVGLTWRSSGCFPWRYLNTDSVCCFRFVTWRDGTPDRLGKS